MRNVISVTDRVPLRPLDAEEIEAFLTCHAKYLANPLTDQERTLIRDIVKLTNPFTRRRPRFPAGYTE